MQLMDAGGDGDAGRAKGVDTAALVHRYGRSFVHSSPDIALEYYMQVACWQTLMFSASPLGQQLFLFATKRSHIIWSDRGPKHLSLTHSHAWGSLRTRSTKNVFVVRKF